MVAIETLVFVSRHVLLFATRKRCYKDGKGKKLQARFHDALFLDPIISTCVVSVL